MANSNFQSTILRWYADNGRSLPWRETRDPYAVWLSEVILQQTRIAQGTDYWHRFMRRWPTVELLATATEDEVLKEWQGLGYYSRARNLHAAARQIVANGGFPHTYENIRALKGVGDYTAAAIASIAFGLPHAAVDGNVYRVLSRYFGITTPINSTAGKKEFQQLADELLPRDKAAAWNQAMMDFGALQCMPQSPRCLLCPLQESCHALRNGKIEELPVKEKKLRRRERFFTYYLLQNNGLTAIHQRGPGDIWQGLWEPLLKEDPFPREEAEVRHILTHQTLYARMMAVGATDADLPEGYQWIDFADLADYALPRLVEKLLEKR
ncbi:A/G-specific adenine glycosylase [Prevotella sp. KH2C16]|uniref:A/G-specific adenine glycosylase n=1 Tax=Prevotella sp. KH2C16 TaxID=1855325 RepID=UPI0008F015C7|nr:A/G-specific adenine glycosylase [Prevotella sp. KH2C16]SFG43389.1 A/G-specific DNA-adenine glycosylase [Prevotella sp. KH2C16]